MSNSDDDEDGERPSKPVKLETDFSRCLMCQKRRSKAQSTPKGSLLLSWWHTVPWKVQTKKGVSY